MSKLLNRAALAAKLGIGETRIQQLVNAGVLTRRSGGFDALECAVALLAYMRRDGAATAARTRRVVAGAVLNERRARQALRQLLTIEEFRVAHADLLGALHAGMQAGTSRAFDELKPELGEMKARELTYVVHFAMLAVLHAYRDATARAVDEVKRGLHSGARLDRVIAELAAAVSGDDEDAEGDDD